jgi:hypothetical protein
VALAARKFIDDGEVLRGPVPWPGPDGPATATVDITVPAQYPFGPPVVHVVVPGADIEFTFHQDTDGALCLWDSTEPAGAAPWTDAEALLSRATALLRWAAESTGRPVVSVCVQRDGAIARADRLPLREDEDHLPVVPRRAQSAAPMRERGCGDSVSPTPPSAVVAAAELAVELARDELTLDCSLPASVLRVLQSQPDEPYTTVSTMTSGRCTNTDTP